MALLIRQHGVALTRPTGPDINHDSLGQEGIAATFKPNKIKQLMSDEGLCSVITNSQTAPPLWSVPLWSVDLWLVDLWEVFGLTQIWPDLPWTERD